MTFTLSDFLADHAWQLLIAALAVIFAYTVFALLGFGSALLAGPPLANVLPVASVIPLLALLDCGGSLWRGWRARHAVDGTALRRLLPAMLLGQLAGVGLLALLPAAAMASLLGLFVMAYGLWVLLHQPAAPVADVKPVVAWLYGLGGGVLGGAFGSGGFVYASYLERNLASREAFRATQAVLIALSTGWRLVLCALAGLVNFQLLLMAGLLLPLALLGAALGKRLDLHLSRQRFSLLLNLLLTTSGLVLLVRYGAVAWFS